VHISFFSMTMKGRIRVGLPPSQALRHEAIRRRSDPLSRSFKNCLLSICAARRRLPATSGQDVGHLRAYLGSGNSMFRREVLMLESPVFDPAFDGGGEDVWLLRKLVECHEIALMWCPEARVREIVPERRATLAFLHQRRFSDGQLRCVVESGAGGLRGIYRVAIWMAVGAAQVVIHGGLALTTRPISRRRSTQLRLTAVGGLGKLLWWTRKLKG
jgi:succinoglycan biosynthesis protein ExoM